ncbi:MAG: glycosyltransferase [Verrucomicrobiaceae bacterium]
MTGIAWQGVFWGSAALFIWAYAGYPLIMKLLAATQRSSPPIGMPVNNAPVRISAVIAVRNEAAGVATKIENLLSAAGPPLHEIIVACDHCTDNTAESAAAFTSRNVQILQLDHGPQGKASALNAAISMATGDLILFADVRQSFATDAIPRLATWFGDPGNGAVSGSLEIRQAAEVTGKGLDTYWSLEKRIRNWESDIDSAIGCTGAIYMIRRELFEPLPADTLLDDVVVPMRIAVRGFRVRFDPEARAFDPQGLDNAREQGRKMRTLAGNFQMLFRYPGWLIPWRNRLWWQLITHKYLRIAGPVLLSATFLSCVILHDHPIYLATLIAQLLLGTLGVLGLAMPGLKSKALSIPAAFLFLQISIIRGFGFWLRTQYRGHGAWK